MTGARARRVLTATALVLGLAAACAGPGADGRGGERDYRFWDPYTQFGDDSEWAALVADCGRRAGVSLHRTGYDGSDLTTRAILAGQQGSSPDVLVLDNPVVTTLAEGELLLPVDELPVDLGDFEENLLESGELDGTRYGVPIGANTLALYYNADVLADAEVDPAAIHDWADLSAALTEISAKGHRGITFAAIGNEEGTYQFLPWFWGSGADLEELDSPAAVAALRLWKGWLDADLAPNSVINNNQTTSWQEFETGTYGFALNGTWQLANARASGIDFGVIPIPSRHGGPAPGAAGGEMVTVPVQEDPRRYERSRAIVECLVSDDNLLTTDTVLSYVAPVEALTARQRAEDPELSPWISAVREARGRTANDLGTRYPLISENLWTAVGNALSGAETPQDALAFAQEAVTSDFGR
ncbi:sugar ABC transporter substrate-binding protein [Actinoalloteichus caeruleus]|uniref:sugar ABC transporter substrate-binding protein n=1 Tax=Actinoalloteichus cyanogriseus TaxID=2893586 RepID=UPI003AAAFD48